MKKMITPHWNYRPAKETVQQLGLRVSGAALYCTILAATFPPAILIGAGLYGAFRTAQKYREHRPETIKKSIVEFAEQKKIFPVPEWSGYTSARDDLTKKFNLVTKPYLYFTSESLMVEALPPVLRLFLNKNVQRMLPYHVAEFIKELPQSLMKNWFGALSSQSVLFMPPNTRGNFTMNQIEFITAHEIAHIKAKDNYTLEKSFIGSSTLAAGILVPALMGLSTAGIALPAAIPASGLSLLGLLGTLSAARLIAMAGINSASRIAERRADRNAVYVTRDLDSACKALMNVSDLDAMLEKETKRSRLNEIFSSHPNLTSRINSLKQSWSKIQEFSSIETASPEPVKDTGERSLHL